MNKFGEDKVIFIEADVTDSDQVKNAIETTYNKFGFFILKLILIVEMIYNWKYEFI